MKNRLRLTAEIFLLCLILLPASSAVSSEIYKWKDKDGKIHYSDTPPPGIEVEIKKFEEPGAREKSKPRTKSPEAKPGVASVPPKSETAAKKPQTEPAAIETPPVPRNVPEPRAEASGGKRPYESVNAIMYMTKW